MRTTTLFSALLLLVLAGCTAGPNYKRPAVEAPSGFRGQAPELAQTTDSLASAKWWNVFQDEQLQGLIHTALEKNYDIRTAAERVLEAQARLGVAHSNQFPTIAAGGDLNTMRQQQTPMGPAFRSDTINISGNASWEIDFWGKYRRATEAVRAQLAASEWGRKQVVSSMVASVASSYFQLRALDLELEITRRSLHSRRESLRLTKILAEGGAVSELDVRQAEQLVYTTSSQIPALERQIEQQENAISILLGQNPGPVARGKALTEQPKPREIPAGVPSQLLERRPDIRQAEEMLIAANAEIGVARAQYFPTIALTGNAGAQTWALTSLFSGPTRLWSFGPSISVPIFNAGRLKNNVRLSEAEQREAELAYQKTIQGAFRDVSDALVACRTTYEERAQKELLVAAAKDSSRLAQIRYEGGAAAYLEVLTDETNYYTAQLNLVQTQLSEMLSLVQLYQALGGGWE